MRTGASTESGFIMDVADNSRNIATWIQGTPVKSHWHGLTIKGKQSREIETMRCTACGFLELYAR